MVHRPKVYANKIEKKINNNQSVYDSSKNNELEIVTNDNFEKNEIKKNINNVDSIISNKLISSKISDLLNTEGYIFNIDVVIKTKEKDYHTHIASVINNHIITLDNDIINLDDVIDIEY